jgi:hypothetical protein
MKTLLHYKKPIPNHLTQLVDAYPEQETQNA